MKRTLFPLIITLVALLQGACENVHVDLGPVQEAYVCKVVLTCDGVEETRYINRCADHGLQNELLLQNHKACEAELTARGCQKIGCDGWCEGKGVSEGDGVLRFCSEGSDVDAGVR